MTILPWLGIVYLARRHSHYYAVSWVTLLLPWLTILIIVAQHIAILHLFLCPSNAASEEASLSHRILLILIIKDQDREFIMTRPNLVWKVYQT
jgi:hypothetical protein